MKNLSRIFIAALLASSFMAPAMAAKPRTADGIPFGNGFPSGSHFNLNLIGKKASFNCPGAEFDENGQQTFGNVIFVPREAGESITILMESGTKGPKGAPDTSKLEVTDWCSETIPDADGGEDPAVLRLPANANGYAVYARVTGKPGDNTKVNIDSGGLAYVEDEKGNDLIALGLVDRNGTATFSSGLAGLELHRNGSETWSTSSGKGKGVQKAENITGLFEWSGEVCYLSDDTGEYCGDVDCPVFDLCCKVADGVYSECIVKTEDMCPALYPNLVTAMCRSYEDEWVFNIADYVGYLWNLDNSGAYVVQIRFYPIP